MQLRVLKRLSKKLLVKIRTTAKGSFLKPGYKEGTAPLLKSDMLCAVHVCRFFFKIAQYFLFSASGFK